MMVFLCLLLYLALCYVMLEQENLKNRMEITKVDTPKEKEKKLLASARETLMNKRKLASDIYYSIIDEFESIAGDFADSGHSTQFDLTEFSIIDGWNRGALSSKEAREKFFKLGTTEKVAEKKVCKKIDRFLKKKGDKLPDYVDDAAHEAMNQLRERVVPIYTKYLVSFRFMLKKLIDIDESQIKLIHGKMIGENPCQIRMISLNQAVRYIKYNELHEREFKYKMCKYLIAFENKTMDNYEVKTTEMDWFLCPRPYQKIVCELFNVHDNHVRGITPEDHLQFFDDIEEVIDKQLGA